MHDSAKLPVSVPYVTHGVDNFSWRHRESRRGHIDIRAGEKVDRSIVRVIRNGCNQSAGFIGQPARKMLHDLASLSQ
jgi:hypothetical protein